MTTPTPTPASPAPAAPAPRQPRAGRDAALPVVTLLIAVDLTVVAYGHDLLSQLGGDPPQGLLYLARFVLALAGVLVAARRGVLTFDEMGLLPRHAGRSLLWAAKVALPLGALTFAALWGLTAAHAEADVVAGLDAQRRSLLAVLPAAPGTALGERRFTVGAVGAQVLGMVVAAPLMEELLYRGLMYPTLRRRMPAWLAVLACGAWFSLLHWYYYGYGFQPQHLICGLAGAWALERTRSLAAAVAFHAGGNLFVVGCQYAMVNHYEAFVAVARALHPG